VGPTSHNGVVKDHKYNLDFTKSRREDQDSYVELPNRSMDEGDMTYTRSAHRVHRSDRCPPK
jgi:hypothetical protein